MIENEGFNTIGDAELECHVADGISLSLMKDGSIDIEFISEGKTCHNVFAKDAARNIAATLDEIASGGTGRYVASNSPAKTVGELDMDDDPHFLISGDEDEFVMFSRDKDQLFGYASDRNDPAIIAIRDAIMRWTE